MNGIMRRVILLAILIVAVLAVSACQRDRPAAEEENWVTPGAGSAVSPLGTAVAPAITSVVTSGTLLPGAQLTPGGFITGTLPTLAAPAGTATPTGSNVVVVGPTYGYVVTSGDTLYSIALANGTDVATIRLLNNLTSDALQIGQVLIVPGSGETGGGTATGTTPTPATVYTVSTGDTLSGIAELFGVTWEEIAAANNMEAPYMIYRGQRLVIPGVEAMPTAPAAGNSIKHVVQEGETLLGIAVQYGTTSQAIMQANGMSDPDFLRVGQELIIPQP
ncbi:MAG: LysM peptidoglycan-binding domain-containing protein [Caldilineales bacterium]